MNAPTTFPANLPALIEALPDDATRPQQTEFTRERQTAFIAALAASGAARKAVRAAGVSHQTAYRMRRACPAFRLAWNAALLAARAAAEDVLACRALDGVEEKVFYHGEEVATRRRFDSRLLLAHLARLDRLTADAATHAFADDFEAALARFERGEDQPEVPPDAAPASAGSGGGSGGAGAGARTGGKNLPQDSGPGGPCLAPDAASGVAPHGAPCVGWCAACAGEAGAEHEKMLHVLEEDGREYYCENSDIADVILISGSFARKVPPPGYADWEADMDDRDHWENGDYLPPYVRRLRAMEEARPRRAPTPADHPRPAEVEELQLEAFEAGVAEWWRVTHEDELEAALARL